MRAPEDKQNSDKDKWFQPANASILGGGGLEWENTAPRVGAVAGSAGHQHQAGRVLVMMELGGASPVA